MNKVIGIIFAIVCISASAFSSSILGIGMWFWIIIGIGMFVGFSQFFPLLKRTGSGLAILSSVISLLTVLLGLLAATVGGSFNMDNQSAILLLLFFMIAILGGTLGIINKKPTKKILLES
tara:strand:+ start:16810 stop:17169 length:360 start_codon:yes stop_codon:yes gene_type:complete